MTVFFLMFLVCSRKVIKEKKILPTWKQSDFDLCVCVDLFLCGDGEFVTGDEAAHLLQTQTEKLLPLHHLSEMLL